MERRSDFYEKYDFLMRQKGWGPGGKGVKTEKTGETTQLQRGNPGLKFPVAARQLKSLWAWKPASPSRSPRSKDKRRIGTQDGS